MVKTAPNKKNECLKVGARVIARHVMLQLFQNVVGHTVQIVKVNF